MKDIVRWALAFLGCALCIGESVVFSRPKSSCPVPAVVLIELAVLGLAGLVAVTWERKGVSGRWRSVTWAVCGGLLAVTVIAVWSIAPWVFLATLVFGGVAILGGRLISQEGLTNLAVLLAASAVNFVLLFPVAKHTGVEAVDVPAGAQVTRVFSTVDYADAYRAKVPAGDHQSVESVSRAVLAALLPCWSKQRDQDLLRAVLNRSTFQPGSSLGGWRVYQKASQEIIVGADESHLDFRVSVLLSEENGVQWVTVSTLVRYNNWKGRAYFVPVRFGHQIVVPHMVRTAVHRLREPAADGGHSSVPAAEFSGAR